LQKTCSFANGNVAQHKLRATWYYFLLEGVYHQPMASHESVK